MNRILTWYFGGDEQPAYYAEREYTPVALRIHANKAPETTFEVDIRDDGVTILANQSREISSISIVYGEIQYSSQSGAFTVGETVTGGTSGATGIVVSDTRGELKIQNESVTSFSVAETITGGTSGSTATVDGYKRGGRPETFSQAPSKTVATLDKGDTLNEIAADFLESNPPIAAGSVITCHKINDGGANGITVQLELESLTDEDEDEP